ncbi:hypothetical protein NEOKW01_1315 [Nematocida sp. AWRm80]|nr:hypothetical protein NEOKW01_1315 [Nematocida sp. AWRm80]
MSMLGTLSISTYYTTSRVLIVKIQLQEAILGKSRASIYSLDKLTRIQQNLVNISILHKIPYAFSCSNYLYSKTDLLWVHSCAQYIKLVHIAVQYICQICQLAIKNTNIYHTCKEKEKYIILARVLTVSSVFLHSNKSWFLLKMVVYNRIVCILVKQNALCTHKKPPSKTLSFYEHDIIINKYQ